MERQETQRQSTTQRERRCTHHSESTLGLNIGILDHESREEAIGTRVLLLGHHGGRSLYCSYPPIITSSSEVEQNPGERLALAPLIRAQDPALPSRTVTTEAGQLLPTRATTGNLQVLWV